MSWTIAEHRPQLVTIFLKQTVRWMDLSMTSFSFLNRQNVLASRQTITVLMANIECFGIL